MTADQRAELQRRALSGCREPSDPDCACCACIAADALLDELDRERVRTALAAPPCPANVGGCPCAHRLTYDGPGDAGREQRA